MGGLKDGGVVGVGALDGAVDSLVDGAVDSLVDGAVDSLVDGAVDRCLPAVEGASGGASVGAVGGVVGGVVGGGHRLEGRLWCVVLRSGFVTASAC